MMRHPGLVIVIVESPGSSNATAAGSPMKRVPAAVRLGSPQVGAIRDRMYVACCIDVRHSSSKPSLAPLSKLAPLRLHTYYTGSTGW